MNCYYASFLLTLIKLCQEKGNEGDIFCLINLYFYFFSANFARHNKKMNKNYEEE